MSGSLVLALGVVAMFQARGPDVEVRTSEQCRACTITLVHEATIGGDDDEDLLAFSDVWARDRSGRFYVHEGVGGGGDLMVFQSPGRYQRTIGRRGEGPGEFEFVYGVSPWPNDTVYVLDAGNHRLTVLDSTLTFVRSARVPVVWNTGARFIPLTRDRGITNGVIPSLSRFGQPFHVLGTDGAVSRSFGYVPETITPATRSHWLRRPIAVVNGRLFAAFRWAFAVEEWTLEGEHLRTLRRTVKWFQPHESEDGFVTPSEPPKPRLVDVHAYGEENLLWVLLLVPDPNWKKGLEEYEGPDGPGARPRSPELVYDTVVELWDVRTASLLSTARFDDAAMFFVDDVHLSALTEDPATGARKHRILHIHLARH